jgi:hypothetical protein
MVNDKPVKWTAKDILKGHKDGYKLIDAFLTPSLFKIDIIAYINSLYMDFSNTYQFYNNKTLINKYELFQPESLDNDIVKFEKEGNYFKMAKRIFVKTDNKKLIPLFNSADGAINQVMSNIDTIIYILENRARIPYKNIDAEIDEFINRLGVLDNMKLVNKTEINTLLRQSEVLRNKKSLITKLTTLHNNLNKIVQSDSKTFLIENKIMKP